MLKRKFNWATLFIVLIIMAFLGNIYSSYNNEDSLYNLGTDSITIPTDDTTFRNAFFSPDINDSLPYYEYRKIQDSFARIKAYIDIENKGKNTRATYLGFIGFTQLKAYQPNFFPTTQSELDHLQSQLDSFEKLMPGIKDKDSLLSMKKKASGIRDLIYGQYSGNLLTNRTNLEYFITFRDIQIKENNHFFVQNGKYYMAHPVWETIKKEGEYMYRSGHYTRIPLKVRYDTDQKMLLIPSNRVLYKFLKILFSVLVLGFTIISIYIIIGLPVSILGSISIGQVFTLTNIRQLKIIYIFLLIISLLKIISPLLIFWFISFFTPPVFKTPSIFESLYSSLPLLIAGLAVILISKAFQKGYKLQQEEDFTV
jgi:hypothetical protein